MKLTIDLHASGGRLRAVAAIATIGLSGLAIGQGDLTPPPLGSAPFSDQALDALGAPRPNMKTLTQTDPGQPIPSKDADLPDLNGSSPVYLITEPGHYYLTQNLIGDQPIIIRSSDVTLDLRGHTIRYRPTGTGPGGTAVEVGPGSTGPSERVEVRNGTVSGDWDAGVVLGDYGTARDLRVSSVQTFGIAVGAQGRVHHCTVQGPPIAGSSGFMPHAGIFGGVGSIISNSGVRESHGHGIEVDRASRIVDCTANCVLGSGFVAKEGTSSPADPGLYQFKGGCTSIEGCASFMNLFSGYDLGPGTTVVNSTACENREMGFHLRAGSVASQCTSRMNRGFGFLAESEDPVDVGSPFVNPRLTPEATSFLHCTATRNFSDGFRATINSTFTHCTSDANGLDPGPAYSPGFICDGFEIVDSCRLVNCMATNNTDAGIRGLEDNYLEQNTIHTNGTAGIDLASAANTVIKNYLKFNGVDFVVGGVVTPGGGVGGIAPVVLPSAAPPLNPFGNFAF
ncbi:MAG: right-handed parallel beta-helix repeat-containing protein [Akkermansiaceae bacterium]|nr:right-handed parallel beta-helix repeat-containing protein [Akkermansiaceae bacterium]